MNEGKIIIVLLGVAGVGKTTVGQLLSDELGWQFIDADDFHPPENIKKMSSGITLTEEDRKVWLEAVKCAFERLNLDRGNAVFAFPGLKQKHREYVLTDNLFLRLIHLIGVFELIYNRLLTRKGHFFPPSLLQSQFDILEPPSEALRIDVNQSPADIVLTIRKKLGMD